MAKGSYTTFLSDQNIEDIKKVSDQKKFSRSLIVDTCVSYVMGLKNPGKIIEKQLAKNGSSKIDKV